MVGFDEDNEREGYGLQDEDDDEYGGPYDLYEEWLAGDDYEDEALGDEDDDE